MELKFDGAKLDIAAPVAAHAIMSLREAKRQNSMFHENWKWAVQKRDNKQEIEIRGDLDKIYKRFMEIMLSLSALGEENRKTAFWKGSVVRIVFWWNFAAIGFTIGIQKTN